MFNNKNILITGGTGSFGKAFTKRLLKSFPKIKRLVVFSRDELKQFEMEKEFSEKKYKSLLRYFIGDVRDLSRLIRAFEGIDIVIHAAALKQVPTAEYNPMEYIKTNVMGAQNIIEASIEKKIKKIIALSSDKAAAPINLYGATKLCSDKLFVAANNYSGQEKLCSVVRYGNVMGSRGSIIPHFLKERNSGKLNITDKSMTRFNITLEQSVDMVLFVIKNSFGSEILVPKIPSYRITDLAKSITPSCKLNVIGIRPGEKIHEEMITESDSFTTFDIGDYYIILPSNNKKILSHYSKKFNLKKVKKGFRYNSGLNPTFLKIEQIRKLIKKHVDKNFKPI